MKTFKSDMSQIRYYFKNETLDSKKKENVEEIERLQKKEQQILEKLKHTLDRQDKIERETNSPIKIRRAPSLSNQAKIELFQNRFSNKVDVTKRLLEKFGNESPSVISHKDSFNDEEDSVILRKNQEKEAEQAM